MMNAKKTLSIIAGAGALALAACSGPQEENLRMVPLTVPTTMPMTSYGPNTRVVVAGVDYTEVHDEWMNQDIMKKATPGNTRVVISRGSQRGQLMVGDEVAMDFSRLSGDRFPPHARGPFPHYGKGGAPRLQLI